MMRKELTKEDKKFLDGVALETLLRYLDRQKPKDFKESVQVARVSYKQALAMLQVRDEQLKEIAKEVKIIKEEEDELW